MRADNCRYEYFKHHHGMLGLNIFYCHYCGKLLFDKHKIAIDHINAVARVRHSRWLRWKYRWKKDGINSLSNLTTSCIACNTAKRDKGGAWVIRGRVGWMAVLFRYVVISLFWYAGYQVFINTFLPLIREAWK